MNSGLIINLTTTPEQAERLQALQAAFAEVCNTLSPVVREQRCWNRVTLHHLTYHALRARFPKMGSQMVCNAIYSVCRTSRLVYQHPGSPFNITKRPDAPLPLIRFSPGSPVYFDRHTLSIKSGKLSMYTLDGRMRFQIDLRATDEERFAREKLREILLTQSSNGYQLVFTFLVEAGAQAEEDTAGVNAELPEYLLILPDAAIETDSPLPIGRVAPAESSQATGSTSTTHSFRAPAHEEFA